MGPDSEALVDPDNSVADEGSCVVAVADDAADSLLDETDEGDWEATSVAADSGDSDVEEGNCGVDPVGVAVNSVADGADVVVASDSASVDGACWVDETTAA